MSVKIGRNFSPLPRIIVNYQKDYNPGHMVLEHFSECHNLPAWTCGSPSPQCRSNQFWSCSKSLLSTLGAERESVRTNVSEFVAKDLKHARRQPQGKRSRFAIFQSSSPICPVSERTIQKLSSLWQPSCSDGESKIYLRAFRLGHFTSLFCRGRQGNVPKWMKYGQSLCFLSINIPSV